MAIGKNHIGTMAGKLNGEMMPTTPSGCRMEETSTLVEAFSVMLPLSRWARPQASSTISWPRVFGASQWTERLDLIRFLSRSRSAGE
jgi:hypothetical protein